MDSSAPQLKKAVFPVSLAVNLLLILAGLCMAYQECIFHGFPMLPGESGDGRFIHFLLEHSWQWLVGNPGHSSYWDAPFFYPLKNTMALSDLLLGGAPFYWICRLSGCSPQISYMLWPGILGVLNYLSMSLVLKRVFRCGTFGAAAGSWLFAFSAPRIFMLLHIQFWIQFYTPLFIWFAWLFAIINPARRARLACAGLAASACLAMQFYSGFYTGWFLLFGTAVFLAVSLFFKNARSFMAETLKCKYPCIIIALLFFMAIMWPLLSHYLAAYSMVGGRQWSYVALMLPDLKSIFTTPGILYDRLIDRARPIWGEHLRGVGLLVPLIAFYGFARFYKKNALAKIFLWTWMTVLFLATFHVSQFFAWRAVFEYFPGANAIRYVSRVAFLLMVIYSIGYALAARGKKPGSRQFLLPSCLRKT